MDFLCDLEYYMVSRLNVCTVTVFWDVIPFGLVEIYRLVLEGRWRLHVTLKQFVPDNMVSYPKREYTAPYPMGPYVI